MRLILAGLAAATLAFAAAPPAQAQTTVPPIDYHERVLANGLHIYSVLDRSTPNVSIQMWYGVGAKNDPAGRSGFAHLFEHLMFKATRDMPAEYMDRLTEDVGGLNNASTDNDYTDYYEIVPANHLQRLLWAEAERLSGLVVDEAAFKSERAVVEEELRQRVLADPYGRLFSLDLPEASFAVHPYHRPPIGSIEDLDAASLADVRAFHAVYYRPDNVSLIVVGDFDPAQLDAWIDQYFAPIARPAWPMPAVTAIEPARTAPRTIDAYGPDVPLPAVVLSYPGPNAVSPDAAALTVLDAVLTTGRSSRLYQSLVYRQQLAQSVFSQPDLRRQPGFFMVGAILAAGKTPQAGLAAIDTELDRLRAEPISPAELTAAKNQLIAGVLRGRETIEGRGFEIGQAITVEGDAARANSDIADLAAVTPADVQRAARTWLVDQRRVLIRYRPEADRPAGEADVLVQDSPQVAAQPLVAPEGVAIVEAADQRQPPPPPGAPVAATLPKPVEQTLPNGLRVIVARTGDLPIVSAELAIGGGSASDAEGFAGLTAMTAGLLTQGTTSRSASDIATAVEADGGALDAGANEDIAEVSLTGLSATLAQSLPILADVARHPAFAKDELDRLRQQKLDNLRVSLSDPGTLANLVMSRLVFGAAPYGHPVDGTPASLQRIDRPAVLAQYQRLFRPDNAILVLTGDIEPDAAFALARQTFGDWARPAGPLPAARPSGAPPPPAGGGDRLAGDRPGGGGSGRRFDRPQGCGLLSRRGRGRRARRRLFGAAERRGPGQARPQLRSQQRGADRSRRRAVLRFRPDPQRRGRSGRRPDAGPGQAAGPGAGAGRRAGGAQGRPDRRIRPRGGDQPGPGQLSRALCDRRRRSRRCRPLRGAHGGGEPRRGARGGGQGGRPGRSQRRGGRRRQAVPAGAAPALPERSRRSRPAALDLDAPTLGAGH